MANYSQDTPVMDDLLATAGIKSVDGLVSHLGELERRGEASPQHYSEAAQTLSSCKTYSDIVILRRLLDTLHQQTTLRLAPQWGDFQRY